MIRIPKYIEESEIRQLIRRRRRQLIVHSIIYYRLNENIISDKKFDRWARELVGLQKRYPKISRSVEYYDDFKDWDGTTGYHLKSMGDPSLISLSKELLRKYKEIE